MILQRLTLKNIGQYYGENSIDLQPRDADSPIILVFGNNGAGKTTIKKSIRLCLYGKLGLGSRISDREYTDAVVSLRHRPSDPETAIPDTCSVTVSFEHATARSTDEYSVSRTWFIDGDRVNESLHITRNGHPLSDMDMDYWPSFISELIPPGVADLFFFDGEDIQELADESSHRKARSAVQMLLGLDLVDRLSADLSIYADRLHPPESDDEMLSKWLSEQDRIKRELRSLDQERSKYVSELDFTDAQIAEAEQEFAELGGLYATRRQQFEAQRDQKQDELDALAAEFRKGCQGSLPFTLSYSLLRRLLAQLETENKHVTITTTVGTLMDKYDSLVASQTANLADSVIESIPVLAELIKSELPSGVTLVHGASNSYREQVSLALREVHQWSEWLEHRANVVKSLQSEIDQLDTSLSRVPDDQAILPVFDRIRSLEATRGKLEMQRLSCDERIKSLKFELSTVESQLEKARDRQRQRMAMQERLKLVGRVSTVVEEYRSRLLEHKRHRLEKTLLECFDQLLHKQGRFKTCKIDAVTFEPQFYDGNRWVPKVELSAGEKQLYATAFLWSLMIVSGRKIPLVIDTPLARLDRTHRRRVAEVFFVRASHQVVVLATDAEIDAELLTGLEAHVSHMYELQHDVSEGRTSVASVDRLVRR
jgi:DNA sulfur modification protein DndD